ncbi:MAG: DMT family transporter [Candidatus Nanohaloarchaea archaeon]|nr:DMT family transporter [Candidatus Nanohaloarchaea archaeon]
MVEVNLVLPLLAAVFAALSNIVAKVLLDDLDFREFIAVSFIWIALFMTPLALLRFELRVTWTAALLVGAVVATDAAANYLYFEAMDVQEVSRLSAVFALGPLFTMLFATVFLPAHLTLASGAAVLTIVAAVYLLNADGSGLLQPFREMLRERNYAAIGAALLFGLSAIPARYALTEYAVTNPETLYWVRALAIGAVLLTVFRPEIRSYTRRTMAAIAGRSLLVIVQWMLYLYAVMGSNVLTTSALARTTPVWTLLFGWLVLDESVTRRKVAAIGLILVTVVFLQSRTFI